MRHISLAAFVVKSDFVDDAATAHVGFVTSDLYTFQTHLFKSGENNHFGGECAKAASADIAAYPVTDLHTLAM